MIQDPSPAGRRALELLRRHDPASSVRPGAAERIEARLNRPAKKARYVAPVVLAGVFFATAGFAARAWWSPARGADVKKETPLPPAALPAAAVELPSTSLGMNGARSSLLEEARLLERVAQALKNDKVTEALAGVDAHRTKYPAGVLRLEALGFRVQAFEQLASADVTDAVAEQWVSALSDLGRCAEAARLPKKPAFARALKGFCPR